ncbi:hypothetical protein [Streptomyces sp. NPDC060022]|uniref:hypothetical protein n=1 Tax=Streptomyces sp. NPDC060022 TaxID=3347039 RepID=UPI00367B60B1
MTSLTVARVGGVVRRLAPQRGTLRQVGYVCVLVVVFLGVNASVAHAATGGNDSADLLAPLNIRSSEGIPIDGYELSANGGSIVSFKSQFLAFVLGGLFTIIRVFVGLACWAVEFAFRFPLLKMLSGPAQKVSDAYESAVVDTLGLKGLLLSWAFVFGLVMVMRGKVGKGLGEIVLTLVIGALAASAFVRPDYLLAEQGPLVATQEAAAEVAQLTVNSYSWGGKIASGDPCAGLPGTAELRCREREAEKPVTATEVARPIQESVTNALVVKPFMLLQYGRILDPAKASDKKAYAIHLRLVSGGYLAGENDKDDPCAEIEGPAKEYCESEGHTREGVLPPLTPGNSLLETASPVLTEEDQQLAAALEDLEKAGPVGKACAEYAKKPTWWRAGGAVLLLIAALLICAMLLSAVIVLLGTQAADVAAAAAGVVAFVLGMLPGPSRQAVWKWFAVFAISMLSTFAICMFIPFFGIAVDAILTNGPDLMIERILLLDVMALVGLAFHRRLLSSVSSFGNRMAMRMRSAKVGGSHLPGDTSEIGAALAMHMGGQGGAGIGMLGRPSAAAHVLGMRHGLLNSVAAMADGAGQPIDGGRLLGEAVAEGRRGMAPVMLGLAGGRLALRGAYGALIGRRPQEEDESVKLLRLIAKGETPQGGGEGSGDTMRVHRVTGEILPDPSVGPERALIGSRVHEKAMRFRGYRVASRTARVGYGATLGAPRNVKAGARAATEVTQEARTQLRVAANQVREDAGEWGAAGRATVAGIDHVSQRAAATWQAHDPAAAVRTGVRNAAAGAIFATAPTSSPAPDPTGPGGAKASAARQEDPAIDARRRVFDALMRAQRTGWDSEPSWGGDAE